VSLPCLLACSPLARRALSRSAFVGALVVGLLATGVGIASAHVTVSSPDAAQGGFGKVVFSVPNESDAESTVRVRIQVPDKTPLASLLIEPVPGWTITTTTTQLATPLTTDDGQKVTTAISVIDFAATPGGGIAPGRFLEFALSGGPFPKVGSIAFNVVQTYSDGTEAAWIDPTVQGQPEPQHPAPVLTLTSSSGSTSSSSAARATTTSSGSGSTPAWVALSVAVLALLVALAGAVLGWRARRRTVSS
jgi:uncharacterized protein YcnI